VTPKTLIEASALGYFKYLKAPGPVERACPSSYDRAYLFCPQGTIDWLRTSEYTLVNGKRHKRFTEQGWFGKWITCRLHKRPSPGSKHYSLTAVFREDVPGVDRFALQVNVWRHSSHDDNPDVFEVDFDGWGATHFPAVVGHVAMGAYHFIARTKTDPRAVAAALRNRGIDVEGIPT
jgi:hypothetical protein